MSVYRTIGPLVLDWDAKPQNKQIKQFLRPDMNIVADLTGALCHKLNK